MFQCRSCPHIQMISQSNGSRLGVINNNKMITYSTHSVASYPNLLFSRSINFQVTIAPSSSTLEAMVYTYACNKNQQKTKALN